MQQVYYIYADHLNTPRQVVNQHNQVVWEWRQDDPFGNNVPVNANGFVFNLRLPGQYFDQETGLHYNYYRDYDPLTGRYVQFDPVGLAGGLNGYAYVGGNPISYTDPKGLVAQAIPGVAAIGGLACYFTPGCRKALEDLGRSVADACGQAGDRVRNWYEQGREKDVPDRGQPGDVIEGERRTREYGPDGKPVRDYDKPHQGYGRPHVHEWPDGVREHPGRDYSPWPR